jgi:phosphoribosylaminoimidazolecarboxamide formyltransferase/IMP cyclohydrolase
VVDPADYPRLAEELKAGNGVISEQTNFELACKAFEHTHHYDDAIAAYLAGVKG